MDKNFLVLICTLSVCLPSCTIRHGGRQTCKELFIGKESLSSFDCRIPCDTVQEAEGNSDLTMYVADGKLCKRFFPNKDRPMTLEIRELDQEELLYSYVTNEDHLVLPIRTWCSNQLIIHDQVAMKTLVFDLGKAAKDSAYTPEKRNSNIMSSRVLPWKDGLIFLNKSSYINGIPRVCFSDKTWNYHERHKYSFNSHNVVHGELICRENHPHCIAYVPENDNTIEILDEKGRIIIKTEFYHESKQAVDTINQQGITVYVFKWPPVICFSSACAGNNTFIVGFVDDVGTHSVAILDWEGNMLGGFKVGGEIRELSYSKDERTIYAYERIGDHDFLIKYESPLK